MSIGLIALLAFLYTMIGYRIGYGTQKLMALCRSQERDVPARIGWKAKLLLPAGAGKEEPWTGNESEIPSISTEFDRPESYALLMSLLWPFKFLFAIPSYVNNIYNGRVFIKLMDGLFRPDALVARLGRRVVKRRLKALASALPATTAKSPSARIDEINETIGKLVDERKSLEGRPDGSRL